MQRCEVLGCSGFVVEMPDKATEECAEYGECNVCGAAHYEPCRDCGCRTEHSIECMAERSRDRQADADRERDDEQSICDDFAADHRGAP